MQIKLAFGLRTFRVDTLLWMSGVLLGILGMLVLVTPQQVNFTASASRADYQFALGIGLLLASFLLLSVVVARPARRAALAATVLSGLMAVALAIELLSSRATVAGLMVLVYACAVLTAPLLSSRLYPAPEDAGIDHPQPHLFPVTCGLSYMVAGLYLLSPWFTGNTFFFTFPPANLQLIAAGLVAAGAWVVLSELRIVRWAWLSRAVLLGFSFLLTVHAAPNRMWIPALHYIFTFTGLVVLPLLVFRTDRPSITSLRARLALMASFCATCPLIMAIAIMNRQPEPFTVGEPASEISLGLLLLILIATLALGFVFSRALTIPLLQLAEAMEAYSATRSMAPLPPSSIAEIRRLSGTFEMMRERLEVEALEREQAQQSLVKAKEALEERVIERTTELETAHQRLRAVLQSLPVGVRIVGTDGEVIQINEMMGKVWGQPDAQNSRDPSWAATAWWGSTNEQIRPGDWPMARALQRGETTPGETIDIIRPNGERASILAGSAPVYDRAGNLLGAVEFAYDISRLTQLEHQMIEAIREARRKSIETEGVFNALTDAVIAYDMDGAVRLANSYAIAMFGFDPLHHNRATVAERLAPRASDGEPFPMEEMPSFRAFQGEFLVNQRMEFRNLRGRTYVGLVTASPILIRGKLTGVVEIWHDVTQQERLLSQLALEQSQLRTLTERLERSNRDLEQFAYVASHDLQEPLRKVNFFGERLKEMLDKQLTEQEVEYIERMLSASRRMQKMIQDLLTFSRVHTKAQPFKAIDLNQVAAEVLSDLEITIIRSKGEVEISSLPTIDADALQMRQLLQNLISNGLKFHPPEQTPRVEVSCREAQMPEGQPAVELHVHDNGIGFEMKHAQRIFQPFERLNGRTEYEGSGMGLAICLKIAERHHGEISAQSEPGEGATFIVRLPVRQPLQREE